MSSSVGRWREEQILIICPGSQTTMAQMGCSELTPATHRIPTRMFKDGNQWRPYQTFKRTRVVAGIEQEEWVEDVDSNEGAVHPIKGGNIVEMDAFLAFLDHVHSLLTTTYHNTPIMLMASPQWTRPDCETIARYVFEKTRTPALCLIHSALATQYGLKWPHMTVIDVGFEKVDITAVHDGRVVNYMSVGSSEDEEQISGGEMFTQRLIKLLNSKDFNYEMAEQLKKSAICEVLPYNGSVDGLNELPANTNSVASAPVATAVPVDAIMEDASKPSEPNDTIDPAGQLQKLDAEDEVLATGQPDEDGVLDVAAIVTSGQTKEFLARKEKEKETQKGKPGRKPKDKEELGPTRTVRLPNSKRQFNTFAFEDIIQEEVPPAPPQPATYGHKDAPANVGLETGADTSLPQPIDNPKSIDASAPVQALVLDTEPKTEADTPEKSTGAMTEAGSDASPIKPVDGASAPTPEIQELKADEPQRTDLKPQASASGIPDTPEYRPKRIKRDIEVGLERFTFADRQEIDRIVSGIYRTIQGIDDMYMRPPCWENLVFVGNGARLRGLKDNILQTLNARHLISPSNATIFSSELPSNAATPTGTGSQTPTGSFTGAPHQLSSSGVNPLLQAATTASSLGVAAAGGAVNTPQAGSDAAGPASHHFHSQTPTNIRTAALPTYLSEWTKHGFEEAMFLGAQVAARIAFCVHSNLDAQAIEAQRQMSFSRVDYNELGPKGIRTHSMLG